MSFPFLILIGTIGGKKMNSGIYEIINLSNEKVYIGQTNNFTNRRRQHITSLIKGTHYNKHLQRAFDKYGKDSFSFRVIEKCEEDKLNDRERYWINKKETEYHDKGYNMSYAYTLFKQYDSNRKVNKSNRVFNEVLNDPEVKAKARQGIVNYYKDPANRLKRSLEKTTLEENEIMLLKYTLAYNFDMNAQEISTELNIDLTIVSHTIAGKCYLEIVPELNHLIKSRNKRAEHKFNKQLIKMWCQGKSTINISKILNVHQRTIIRRLKTIRDDNIDRHRLNSINYVEKKRFNQIKLLKALGYSQLKVSKTLRYSRDYVRKVWNLEKPELYDNVQQCRGINTINGYNI